MAPTMDGSNSVSTPSFPDCNENTQQNGMPVSPACGGLHALCRPRFFAGQLLTEEDLNRLDRYVTEKNRLHNRHIHGWGVVCGLEVTCTPCASQVDQGTVVVSPGYALSPCGNDIVVSKPEKVDICGIIRRCLPPEDECLSRLREIDCGDDEEDWILAVCYNEQTARDVAALRAACNGRESTHAAGQSRSYGQSWQPWAPSTTYPWGGTQQGAYGANISRAPQCEPTVVCETYSFRAYREKGKQQAMVAIVKRLVCCLAPFWEEFASFSGAVDKEGANALNEWVRGFKESLRDFVRREGQYDCEVEQRLAEFNVRSSRSKASEDEGNDFAEQLVPLVRLVLQKCFCSAMLPPCPEPSRDDCVPIAKVTVRKKNPCRVAKVCNVSARRFLLTWPNIHYWLSWTPFFGPATGSPIPQNLRDLLVQECCTDEGTVLLGLAAAGGATADKNKSAPAPAPTPAAAPQGNGGSGMSGMVKPKANESAFASLLANALTKHEDGAALSKLLLAVMGVPDAAGNPLLSEEELRNPGEFLLMNQLLAPVLKTMLPTSMMGATWAAASANDLPAMRAELNELSKVVRTQAETIQKLKKTGK